MSFFTLNDQNSIETPDSGKGRAWLGCDTPKLNNDSGVKAVLRASRFNWIRNSGFWFAQRQTPGTLTTYSPTLSSTTRFLTADGWGVQNSADSIQYRRVDTLGAAEGGIAASRFYGEFTKLTTAGKIAISQNLESQDSEALRNQLVRFQFSAKGVGGAGPANWRFGLLYTLPGGAVDSSNLGLVLTMNAIEWLDSPVTLGASFPVGTAAYLAPSSSPKPQNSTIVGSAATFVVTTGVWQQYGCCFQIPANAIHVAPIIFSNASLATGAGISIAQAGLTVGSEIQDWSSKSNDIELARVQRQYQKTFNINTAPAQNAGLSGAIRGVVNIAGAAVSSVGFRFAVPLLSRGAQTFFNPSAANAFARNTTAGTDATATAVAGGLPGTGTSGSYANVTGIAAWAVGASIALHYVFDAEL